MDKDKLKQYMDVKCEIVSLGERLHKMRCPDPVHDAVTGSAKEIPFQVHTIHIFGVEFEKYQAKRDRLEIVLTGRIAQCQALEEEVNGFIATIPDSRIRRIMDMRYLDGEPWKTISRALGSHEESYARKIHDKYLSQI